MVKFINDVGTFLADMRQRCLNRSSHGLSGSLTEECRESQSWMHGNVTEKSHRREEGISCNNRSYQRVKARMQLSHRTTVNDTAVEKDTYKSHGVTIQGLVVTFDQQLIPLFTGKHES